MKTLYEGILSGMEDTLTAGDNYVETRKAEMKELLKELGLAKNYEGGYALKNARSTGFFTQTALNELGYDANHIKIMMYTMDSFNYIEHNDEWEIIVSLSKYEYDDNDGFRKFNKTVWEKNVYIDRWTADNWRGIVKNVIKPATKNKETFKKFLDNMEKYDEQYISPTSLLK